MPKQWRLIDFRGSALLLSVNVGYLGTLRLLLPYARPRCCCTASVFSFNANSKWWSFRECAQAAWPCPSLVCNRTSARCIPNSVFINCDCLQRYFDYHNKSCLREHQLVVRFHRHTLGGRCSHWLPVELDVLSIVERLRHLASLLVLITVLTSLTLSFAF